MGENMKKAMVLAALAAAVGADRASAYEFPLEFTPAPGAVSHLNVVGYKFVKGQVVGDCSYDITTSGSGRDPRSYTTYYYYTCTWDHFGAYVSQVARSASATPPPPISSAGGVTIYAKSGVAGSPGFHTTGVDGNGGAHGFVTTASPVYAWTTLAAPYVPASYTSTTDIPLTVVNNGDLPLKISKVVFVPTVGKLTVKSNGCPTTGVAPGASCVIDLTYDPTGVAPGDNPYTLYDHIGVSLTSNAPKTLPAPVFAETLETAIPGG